MLSDKTWLEAQLQLSVMQPREEMPGKGPRDRLRPLGQLVPHTDLELLNAFNETSQGAPHRLTPSAVRLQVYRKRTPVGADFLYKDLL